MNVRLRLPAQAEADCQVGLHTPVVANEGAVMNIAGRRAVFTRQVVLVGRAVANAVRIAVGVAEHVEPIQRDLAVDPRVHIGHNLILVIDSGRFHQIDRTDIPVGEHATSDCARKGSRQRRVDVARPELVQPM